MGDSMIKSYLAELRLRGEQPVRARATMVLGALVSGLASKMVSGQKPDTLDPRVVAGAVLALEQADLYQAGPVVAHLRLAAALMIKQSGTITQPLTAEQLRRWVTANGFWQVVKAEVDVQQGNLLAAVVKADSERVEA